MSEMGEGGPTQSPFEVSPAYSSPELVPACLLQAQNFARALCPSARQGIPEGDPARACMVPFWALCLRVEKSPPGVQFDFLTGK